MRQQLRDMKKESEQQLHDMKKLTEQQLHDMKKLTEQQLCDMRQLLEQQEQQLKEQIDASEKRLQTTEGKLTKMQLKNKSLKRELHEMVQKVDANQITQTTNFMDYNPMNSSISRNSSDNEEERDGTSND